MPIVDAQVHIWGSGTPLPPHRATPVFTKDELPCTWRQCVTLFTEELPWLRGRDQELVMGRALCAWLDWTLPG